MKVKSMLQDLPSIVRLDQMAENHDKEEGYKDTESTDYLQKRLAQLAKIQNPCMVRNNEFGDFIDAVSEAFHNI